MLDGNPFRFRPNPTAILLAIAYGVMIAGGTIFILLFAIMFTQSPGTQTAALDLPNWLPALAVGATLTSILLLWRHASAESAALAEQPPALMRAAYAIGLGLVIGWWLVTIAFGLHIIV